MTADLQKMGEASHVIRLEVTVVPKRITAWVEPATREWD